MTGFPKRYHDVSLDNYVATTPSEKAALQAARRFAEGDIGSLVLAGPVGCGKTHLAIAAARARKVKRPGWTDPEWCSVPELMVGLRHDFGRPADDREWEDLAAGLRTAKGVVVLDDLGQEKSSDWTGEIIYTLANGRYNDILPTIASTNLTQDQLAASPYWSVVSRLAQDGVLIRIVGADHRMAKATR